jgi:hypothetical protein
MRRRTTGSWILTQGFHDSNNEWLVYGRKREFAVVVVDKIQLDKLESVNNDFVGHHNNIINFRNDDWISCDGLDTRLDGMELGLVGWLSFGFDLFGVIRHLLLLMEMGSL